MNVLGINHLTLAVSNVEEAFRFYAGLLGFKPVMKSEVAAYVTVGGAWIALVADGRPARENESHIAFDVAEEDFEASVAELMRAGVHEWPKGGTEGDSFFFLDPSGNRLELHVGGMRDRLAYGRLYWTRKVEWFEP